MSRKYILLSSAFFLCIANSFSQAVDSTSNHKFSGYVDAYYAYYTDEAGTGNYQKFPTISPRSNQFGLNSAMLSYQYDGEKVRGIAALHFGDIPRSSWSSTFNYIMEAHAGVRLCKKLWVDGGFFRSHFGTEGLLPKENIASSLAVHTYYEPLYEAGARLNYNPTDKLSINLYVLNGYNIYEENNDKKSLGVLATYALGDKGNIGYCNYIGDDTPEADTIAHLRIHQNVFFNYQVNKLKVQIGVDYCTQQNSKLDARDESASMFSSILSLKYQVCNKFGIYGRGEYFNDPDGFMSTVILDKMNNLTGYKLWGATLGVECKPTDDSYIRLEGRLLQFDEDQEIFFWDGESKSSRMEFMLNTGITF